MELEDLGKKPIEGESTTGSDARYEPEFEALEAEIDKMSSPTASGGVDWKKVVQLCSEILGSKSKDLLVASYLSVGLTRTKGAEGFCIGVKVLGDLLETYWDKLFPSKKRMRGRMAAIEWWAEKTEAALEKVDIKGLSRPRIEQLKEDMEKLASLVSELFPDPPSVITIQRFVEAIPLEEEKPPKEEAPPSEVTTSPQPQAPKVPPPPAEAEISSAKDAERAVTSALTEIKQAATFLWEQDKSDPRAYRWRRLATWAIVDSPPPALEGKTMIPPPPAQIKGIFEKLETEGDWNALLEAAEGRSSEFVFWLDLHYYVSEALGQLGEKYEAAREAVTRETAYFLMRIQGIEDLSFSDGTPFAQDHTKVWLKGISLAKEEEVPESHLSLEGTPSLETLIGEELKEAQKLTRKRKVAEAIRLLHNRVKESSSGKEELLWRLALCQILVHAKKAHLAAPHAEHILDDIKAHGIEKWEPDLALRALRGVLSVFQRLDTEEYKDKAASVVERIAKVDPAAALKLKKK